jgi:hypothetical protein
MLSPTGGERKPGVKKMNGFFAPGCTSRSEYRAKSDGRSSEHSAPDPVIPTSPLPHNVNLPVERRDRWTVRCRYSGN